LSAAIEMSDVSIGCVFQHRGIEVPIMAIDELADAAWLHR
jgi:hypothetical protein